jgi:hypothetical protein
MMRDTSTRRDPRWTSFAEHRDTMARGRADHLHGSIEDLGFLAAAIVIRDLVSPTTNRGRSPVSSELPKGTIHGPGAARQPGKMAVPEG